MELGAGGTSVNSWYVGYAGDQNSSWVTYRKAHGAPELNGTSVDRLLWTKDTFQTNILTLQKMIEISPAFC